MRFDGRSRPTCQIMENKILGIKNLPSAIWSKLNPPEWQTSKVVYCLLDGSLMPSFVNLYMRKSRSAVHLVRDPSPL